MARVFDHVLIVMFENAYRSYVMANPYMRWLASQGVDMANYHGVMRPSQPNYIASVAGQLCGVWEDDDPRAQGSSATTSARCLIDLIEPPGSCAGSKITWKFYMEDYVGDLRWVSDPPYASKHNPLYLFDSVHADPARQARIVDARELIADVEAGRMPNYAWLTPNMWNDGHWLRGTQETSSQRELIVNQIANWLERDLFGPAGLNFPGPQTKLPPRTLVVLTFDETEYEAIPDGEDHDMPNQIYTVLLGDLDAITPGTVIHEGYNHYSLLRTIEDNFELGTLGRNDAAASPLRFLAGERFAWSNPETVAEPPISETGAYAPMTVTSGLALGTLGERAYLIGQGDGVDARPYWASFDGERWTPQRRIASLDELSGPMAVAGTTTQLVLVDVHQGAGLRFTTFAPARGWSEPAPVPKAEAIVGPIALASFAEHRELMLVYHGPDGLRSMTYADGEWSEPVAIAAAGSWQVLAGGRLALAELGNLLLLVYEAPDGKLTGLTYSLADYNTMRMDEGTVRFPSPARIWSAAPATLAHLPGTPEWPTPVTFETSGALAMAELDGGLYLCWSEPKPTSDDHPAFRTDWLHWSCYSLAGVLTSEQTTSYGDLDETSWGPQHRLAGAPLRPGGAAAMTRLGDGLLLVFGPADSRPENEFLFACQGAFAPSRSGPRSQG